MLIPTINTSSIKQPEISALMNIGFCYVELPNEALPTKINTCLEVAQNFFKKSGDFKAKCQLKKLNIDDRYQGYALHRVTNVTGDRVSMVYFVNPNYQRQVLNYVNKKIIAPTGELFIKQQFTEYYD